MVRSTAKDGEKHPHTPKIGAFLGPPAGSAPSALWGGPPGPPYRPPLNWTSLDFAPSESGPPKNGPPGGPPRASFGTPSPHCGRSPERRRGAIISIV
jgi:hypothetical protein